VALHAAVQSGQIEMIRLLLEEGADASIMSDDGKKALDFALENGHEAAAKLIQDAY
jgi:ankyrin repeat protein